jgi:microcystin-dependent protein
LDPFLGEIRLMSFMFAPRGWALCAGQTLGIQQNTALFSLLGTYYGGNGINTFMLPDLRGRVPVHMGQGSSGTYNIGQKGGTEYVTLSTDQIPQHNHLVQAVNTTGNALGPMGNLLAQSIGTGQGQPGYVAAANTTTLNPASIQPAGNSQPHENRQPFLVMSYCIALQGIFPSRN